MRPRGSPKALERRRQRAAALLASGLTMQQVARRLRVSVASVCRWQQKTKVGGPEALAAKPVPGRPRKLTDAERQRLLRLLKKGAKVYGYPDDRWTLKRVADVILREFDVVYHIGHVWRLLRQCGGLASSPATRKRLSATGTGGRSTSR
jgi:transposase